MTVEEKLKFRRETEISYLDDQIKHLKSLSEYLNIDLNNKDKMEFTCQLVDLYRKFELDN